MKISRLSVTFPKVLKSSAVGYKSNYLAFSSSVLQRYLSETSDKFAAPKTDKQNTENCQGLSSAKQGIIFFEGHYNFYAADK